MTITEETIVKKEKIMMIITVLIPISRWAVDTDEDVNNDSDNGDNSRTDSSDGANNN